MCLDVKDVRCVNYHVFLKLPRFEHREKVQQRLVTCKHRSAGSLRYVGSKCQTDDAFINDIALSLF